MPDWPEGVECRVFEALDSTMAEAARQAPRISRPTWLLALNQTAATGRRGRAWAQPAGSFAATLVWPAAGDVAGRALRSFVAALALRDALVAVTGDPGAFRLKWPNDVLLNGGKVAGILLESIGAHLAIGVGVNLLEAPDSVPREPGAPRPVSLAGETGARLAPEEFLAHLAPAYQAREAAFVAHGFAPIRAEWLDHAARLGQEIVARIGDERVAGVFQTVDQDGMLVLATGGAERRIAAADVFF